MFWGGARNTMQQKLLNNFFIAWSWSLGKEHWLETLKAKPKNNNEYFFRDICSVNSWIQMAVFFKRVVFYYANPNFLTLKVAKYFKGQKLTETICSEKCSFRGKIPKIPPNYYFFCFFQKFNPLMVLLQFFMILQKSGSSVIARNAPSQSDCNILWPSIYLEGPNGSDIFFALR